jgi:hypothetical protein
LRYTATTVPRPTTSAIAPGAQKSIARERRRRQFELDILGQVLTAVEETDLLDDIEFHRGSCAGTSDLVPEVLKRQRETSRGTRRVH